MSQALILRQDTTLAPKMIRDTFVLEIHFVESTGKCKLGYSLEKLFFWFFKLECIVWIYCCFFLYARHLFICEIIEIDLLGNILSGEFITRISDEAKKMHDTKTYRA